MDIEKITESLKNCPCGRRHTLQDIRVEIFEGALQQTAVLLKESGFSEDIHLVADLNTLQAADGILELLKSGGKRHFHYFRQPYAVRHGQRSTCPRTGQKR